MSKVTALPLHVEWTPDWVQVANVTTGETAAGQTVSELTRVTAGHKQAIVGVGRSAVFLRTVRLPKAPVDDLRRILSVQVGQMFPLPADKLAFDFLQTPDHTAEGWLTVVAAMRAEDLKRLREDLSSAGLTAPRILPIALASPGVAAHAGVADALVVEAGAKYLSIDVVQRGVVRFSRIAPVASDPLVEAQRTLAAAGTADLAIVAAKGTTTPDGIPSTGNAIGLLNMAPPFAFELADERARQIKERVAARVRLASLMMAAAVLLTATIWIDRNDKAAAVTQANAKWTRQITALKSVRDAEIAQAESASAVLSLLRRATQPTQPLSDIVGVVADSLPSGAWLTGITTERGKPLQVRGTAPNPNDVGKFVSSLDSNPRFRNVRLVSANSGTVNKTPVVEFSVTATCVGNLPMPAPEKVRGNRTVVASTATGGG